MADAPVVTRFAPSPTGALHIGGARTALFNWLYARGRGGKFVLRIEDTDKARSTDENTQAILDGLSWLGLDWDGAPISQAARADRHAEVAQKMLADGTAFKCFSTPDEIEAFRENARANKTSTLFRSPWRDVPEAEHPDLPFAVRVKAPRDGATTLHDEVQGDVTWQNEQLDDMIILRSDGTPVYMLAVVVDDHDMGVTHVIRGDDHLANAFRQNMIYDAMGWDKPVLAHVPLIFGPDGKKLSKRHGATGAAEYQALGLPDEKATKHLDDVHIGILSELTPQLRDVSWTRDTLEGVVSAVATAHDTKLGKLAGPLRAVLAGRAVSPSVFDMMLVLGRDETLARLQDAVG